MTRSPITKTLRQTRRDVEQPPSEQKPPESGPLLPGVVPIGSDPHVAIEPVNPLIRLAGQFFLIPMAIVIVCVALVFIFRWLTYEKRDLSAYVSALSSGKRTSAQKEQDALKLLNYIQEAKRWQGIYDVTEQLRFNREKFLQDNPDFASRVAAIFKHPGDTDRGARQYLAQVLGLVGGPEAIAALTSALDSTDSETVIHSMIALGRIGDTASIPAIMRLSKSEDRGLRQTGIFVLGNFDSPLALERCSEALNDADPLVQWNAAFGLARHGDARSIPVLEKLLDQAYVDEVARTYEPTGAGTGGTPSQQATFHPERLVQYRATGVRLLGQFKDPRIQEELRVVAEKDKALKVRQAAIAALSPNPSAPTTPNSSEARP